MSVKKIVIDCRSIDSSGIGVYLRECLPFLIKTQNNFLLLGDNKKLQFYGKYDNVEIIDCLIPPFSLRDTFFFPFQIIKKINKCNLFYSPAFNVPGGLKIPVFTTIHDIVFPDIPGLTSKSGLAARMWFFCRAYRKSKKIFTVSLFSKSRIEYHLGKKKPVVVTYSAIRPMFIEYRQKTQNTARNNTIVFAGNIKKHKGLDCLLEAFLLARKEGLEHKLLIIGEKDNFRSSDSTVMKKIEAVEKEIDSIEFTGFVSSEKLMEYFSKARLLIQPSLYEGFGLPPLEAMVLGTQALISDIPVFKEIYKDFPVTFFKAGDPKDLKEKMLTLLKEDNLLKNKSGINSPAASSGVLNPSQTIKISLPEHLISKYTFQKTSSVIVSNLE